MYINYFSSRGALSIQADMDDETPILYKSDSDTDI